MEYLGLLNYALFMAIFIGIYALLALGLNIQWGFAGLFNAGIAGFFAVGAYTSAILTTEHADGRIGGFDVVESAERQAGFLWQTSAPRCGGCRSPSR